MAKEKKLHRSKTNRKIAGVCGGIAETYDIESIIVRIIFFISLFFGGTGLLVYLCLWIFLEEG